MIHRLHISMFMVVLVLPALAQAQTFTTLYQFTGGSDGGRPDAGVIRDAAGNLYGTTYKGGDLTCDAPYGCGVLFKVNTAGTETVLHTFCVTSDGCGPVTPLVRDKAGNIYGTTTFGGDLNCFPGYGCGVVYKVDTAGTETVIHSFAGPDGCNPAQGLVRDKAGNLYGTTSICGSSGYGTVFKVSNAGYFSILHSFTGGSSDGAYPQYGAPTLDSSDNLYGTANGGGAYGYGVVYKVSKNGTLTVLHSFAYGTTDGCWPYGSIAQDKAGNLYGTTLNCGSNNYGTIWKVSKKGNETILHNFVGGKSDGCDPEAGVARDSNGNLYGFTPDCGANYYGAVYKLSVRGKLILLHSFGGRDGEYPVGEVWRTADGTLFGTTEYGGTYYGGTVWSYVPK